LAAVALPTSSIRAAGNAARSVRRRGSVSRKSPSRARRMRIDLMHLAPAAGARWSGGGCGGRTVLDERGRAVPKFSLSCICTGRRGSSGARTLISPPLRKTPRGSSLSMARDEAQGRYRSFGCAHRLPAVGPENDRIEVAPEVDQRFLPVTDVRLPLAGLDQRGDDRWGRPWAARTPDCGAVLASSVCVATPRA
jgi:hypothetical protein